ncbi:hypothetical protein C8Q75DRAFT_803487 [Abortiporus biennis]|nr:hypothetical protein C8Q75DRAFT_803487 [Abortiporus biennis]
MSSTSTTLHSRLSEKRKVVPLLLSSFPAPPTYIPPSPLLGSPRILPSSPNLSPSFLGTNPPPSLPPSSPLPPVPGPSPITEHETLMFISAARNRRASKLSITSTSSTSRRDSIASVMSGSNGSIPSLSPSLTPIDSSSSRSLRSLASSSSLTLPMRFPSVHSLSKEPRIREEDPSEMAHSSILDTNYDEGFWNDEPKPHLSVTVSSAPHSPTKPDYSPSLSDAHTPDILKDVSPLRGFKRQASKSNLQRAISITKLNKELPPLPNAEGDQDRSKSPDIKDILASTPRPRRKSAGSIGHSKSRSSHQKLRRSSTRTGLKRRGSEDPGIDFSQSHLAGPSSRANRSSELPYVQRDDDDDGSAASDYGECIDATGTTYELFDPDVEEKLERQLDGGFSDSDSDIDIHTPLPNLMLRDGMLSPYSTLLPDMSRAPSPSGGRPGSIRSFATTGSVMTKSGILKDPRDSQRRRVRHRDGKLLRGGIGLTTGLGWSDSEDEDAPSPLTKRISSFTAGSRRSSSNSLSTPSPLSRSVSDSLAVASDALSKVQRDRQRGRASGPPTSWHDSPSSSSFSRISVRTSNMSMGSYASSSRRTSEGTSLEDVMEQLETLQESSSTSSGSMPITPEDNHTNHHTWSSEGPYPHSSASFAGQRLLKPKASLSNLRPPSSRIRTVSTASTSSTSASIGSSPKLKPHDVARTMTPRPLRLPQAAGLRTPNSRMSDPQSLPHASEKGALRPKTPSLTSVAVRNATLSKATSLQNIRSSGIRAPSTPSRTLATPVERPKPRTGTGMPYRTGSSNSTPGHPASSRAPPASSALRASAHRGNLGT